MAKKKNNEYRKSGMLNEDMSATANLPQEVMMKMYPNDYRYDMRHYNDAMEGMDEQMNMDRRMISKSNPKSRY
jgi:hypothetical protein